jgi:hypothetical protein
MVGRLNAVREVVVKNIAAVRLWYRIGRGVRLWFKLGRGVGCRCRANSHKRHNAIIPSHDLHIIILLKKEVVSWLAL